MIHIISTKLETTATPSRIAEKSVAAQTIEFLVPLIVTPAFATVSHPYLQPNDRWDEGERN